MDDTSSSIETVLMTESFENILSNNGHTVNLSSNITGDAGATWDVTNGLEVQRGIVSDSTNGSAHAELDAYSNSTISTTIDTTGQDSIRIEFDYNPRTGNSSSNMKFSVDGIEYEIGFDGTVTPNNQDISISSPTNGWYSISGEFPTSSDSIALSFSGAGSSDSVGALLDNIKVTGISTSLEVDEDTSITVDVLANDSDVDGDILSITHIQGQAVTNNGAAVNVTDNDGNVLGTAQVVNGKILFTPDTSLQSMNDGDLQAVSFEYTISDGQGGTDTAIVSLNIEGTNDAPVITVTDTTATEDISQIIANVSDIDGTIDSSTLSADNGTVTIDGNGNIIYTPNANYNGTDSVTISVTDNDGATTTQTFSVDVASVNDAPIANNDTTHIVEVATTTTIFDTSFESDAVSVNGTVAAFDGWSSDTGQIELRNTSLDGGTGVDGTRYIELNTDPLDFYNDAPNIFRTVDTIDGAEYTLDFDFSARPKYDATVCRMEVLVDGVVVGTYSADGTFLTTPSWNNETITFTGNGSPMRIEFREAGVDINYGRGIFLDDIELTQTVTSLQEQTISTDEDSALTISVLSNDTDVDGDILSITHIQGQAVTNNGAAVNVTDNDGNVLGTAQVVNGQIQFNPIGTLQDLNDGENQDVTFEYTISDGQGGTDTANVTLNVIGSTDNTAPIINEGDTSLTEDVAQVIGTAIDNDGTITSSTLTADNGTVTIDGSGNITYTPDANFFGTDTVNVSVTDNNGATTTQTITVSVAEVNDAPELTVESTKTVDEDGTTSITYSVSDIDGTANVTASADNGTVVVNNDGTITYTPDSNYSGADTITVTATDNDGSTVVQSSSITVNAVADAPIISASIENGTVIPGTSSGSFTATDNFADNSDWSGVGFSTQSGGKLGLGMHSTRDEYASKTFSFGAENANQTVTISFDTTLYGWDSNDDLIVKIDDIQMYTTNGSSSNHTFTARTDENGDLKIEFRADSGYFDGIGIDNLVISGTGTNTPDTYEYDFNITNAVTDSSESLGSVTVSGLPSGATLSSGTDNGDGTWSVAQGDISGLKIITTSPLDNTESINVSVTSTDGSDTATSSSNVTMNVDTTAETPNLTVSLGSENEITTSGEEVYNETRFGGSQDLSVTNWYERTIDLGADANSIEVSLRNLGTQGETMVIRAYNENGELVETFTQSGSNSNISETYTFTSDSSFTKLIFSGESGTSYEVESITATNVGSTEYEYPINISASTNDDSESITSIEITGLPTSGTLTNTNGDTLTIGNDGSITLTLDQVDGLTLTSPVQITEAAFDINVIATSTESNGGDTALNTAVLVDGIVEGAYYETSSGVTGYTDENGSFNFREGDSVTFSVGGVVLGTATAEDIASGQTFLQDIADVDRTDLNDEYLENMAVFLQSIDTADSGDNIVITQAMRDALADVTIDLTMATEEEVKSLIESIGGNYVGEDEAMVHVQEMLQEYAGIGESEFDERISDDTLSATLGNEPQSGIEFTTSSGVSGITDDNGNFFYNEGDEITFTKDGEVLSTIDSNAIGDDSLITFNELESLNQTEIDFENLELDFDSLSEITDSDDTTVYEKNESSENEEIIMEDMLINEDSDSSLSTLLGETEEDRNITSLDELKTEETTTQDDENNEYCPFKALEESSGNLISNIEADDTTDTDDHS